MNSSTLSVPVAPTRIKAASHLQTNATIFNLIVANTNPSSKILDFGAGVGSMCQRLGEHFEKQGIAPGSVLTACEIVPEEFQYAAVECRGIDTSSTIPFDDNTFDLIYAIEVLEHTPRPYDFFAEAARCLKPGGLVVFSTPNILQFRSRLLFLLTGFGELYLPPSTAMKNAGRLCGHIMPLNYAYFHYALRKNNFNNIRHYTDRVKRGALYGALLCYPLLRLAARLHEAKVRHYDPEVYEENRQVLKVMNSLPMLTARSCLMTARKSV